MKNTGAYDLQYFRSSEKFQTDQNRANRLAHEIMSHFPDTVLDVGCGWGAVVKLLRAYGITAYGVDNAEALKGIWKDDYFSFADARSLPFGNKEFDIVFSSDFFEHIEEEDIGRVANEMRRVGNLVLAEIAFEVPLTERQAKYHVTNKPREWWEKELWGIEIL